MQYTQAVGATEVMSFAIGASSHKIGATFAESMRRRIWPRQARGGHGMMIMKSIRLVQADPQNARGPAHPQNLCGNSPPLELAPPFERDRFLPPFSSARALHTPCPSH